MQTNMIMESTPGNHHHHHLLPFSKTTTTTLPSSSIHSSESYVENSPTTTTDKNINRDPVTSLDTPNWRTLSRPFFASQQDDTTTTNDQITPSPSLLSSSSSQDGDHDHVLSQPRPLWSSKQYQQALDLYDQLIGCSDSYVAPVIHDALHVLDQAYRLYGPTSVIGSFNGGKDAVVILHLVLAAHAHYYYHHHHQSTDHSGNGPSPQYDKTIPRPRVVYFDHEDEFPEIISFLHDTVQSMDLDMIAFEKGTKFTEGLRLLVETNHHHHHHDHSQNNRNHGPFPKYPMAFVLGTRCTDPNAGSQGAFSPSSNYMPPFMRVNPILHWTYGHVWHFLRLFHLPYCRLYDQGYTSLGTTKDTLPCPALAVPGVAATTNTIMTTTSTTTTNAATTCCVPKYWPAYMLRDWDQERSGRIVNDTHKKQSTAQNQSQEPSSNPTTNHSVVMGSLSTSSSHLSTFSGYHFNSSVRPSTHIVPEDDHDLLPQLNASSSSVVEECNASRHAHEEDDRISSSSLSSTDPDEHEAGQQKNADNKNITGSSMTDQKSVGILIIGDEILKGQTADLNTQAAAVALRKECVLLRRVVVVPDDQDHIVEEIRRMRRQVDVIITSGGVGPTHDDVTIKSVAVALGQEMVLHEEMKQLLVEKMKNKTTTTTTMGQASQQSNSEQLNEAFLKMATLPSHAKLRYLSEDSNDWPILQCRNIFILPGIPQLFAKKIANLAGYLSSQLKRSVAYKVVLSVDEAAIVNVLNAAVTRHPDVSFGSYPFVSHPEFKTVLTLEGRLVRNGNKDGDHGAAYNRNSFNWNRSILLPSQIYSKEDMDRNVRMALDDLITELPEGSILRVDNDDLTPFS